MAGTECPDKIAGVRVSHAGGYLFDAHRGIRQHIFDRFEPVPDDVMLQILLKMAFEILTDIGRSHIECLAERLRFEEFGLMDMLLNILQQVHRFVRPGLGREIPCRSSLHETGGDNHQNAVKPLP